MFLTACSKRLYCSAFTVVEALTVVTIAAIFFVATVPSYHAMIQNNKITTLVNTIASSLNLARMEAIKRGGRVAVCPASDANFTACGTDWTQGWIVFNDSNNNSAIDSTSDLIRVTSVPGSTGASITANQNVIGYDGSGFTNNTISISLTASGCTGSNARQISITTAGSLSIANSAC